MMYLFFFMLGVVMLRTQASPNPKAQYESYWSEDGYGSNDEPYPSDIYGSEWIYGSNQGM